MLRSDHHVIYGSEHSTSVCLEHPRSAKNGLLT